MHTSLSQATTSASVYATADPKAGTRVQRKLCMSDRDPVVVAVAALDDLVTAMLKTKDHPATPNFLDWVVGMATDQIQLQVAGATRCGKLPAVVACAADEGLVRNWVRLRLENEVKTRFSAPLERAPYDLTLH